MYRSSQSEISVFIVSFDYYLVGDPTAPALVDVGGLADGPAD